MLSGQKILVVGGSSGMGLATARRLAADGAEVIIASRSQAGLAAALTEIPGKASATPLDFTLENEVRRFFKTLGALDHLVLMGAGKPAWGALEEIGTEALENAFVTKFRGYFFCVKHAVPHLRRDGSVLFTIGAAARTAIPGTAGVAAVNGAILAMARALARELAPLRVNVLSPGLVDTPAYDWMSADDKAGFFRRMGDELPVGRIGRPEEIAEAASYLIGNGFTTGAVLDVDGGARLN